MLDKLVVEDRENRVFVFPNLLRAMPIKAFYSDQGVAVGALMELKSEKRVLIEAHLI